MDPVSIVAGALVAGAVAGTTNVASQAVMDAYAGLKRLIVRRFGSQADVADALARLEARPDSKGRRDVVQEEVEKYTAFHPIRKRTFSCFGDAGFVERFNQAKVATICLIGIEAHVCVMQTALDALDQGFGVFVIIEATGSRRLHHRTEAMLRLREAGAVIGSVEMFAFEALRSADPPRFRKVQGVIL